MLTVAILVEQNRVLRAENDELRETIRQMREAAVAPPPLPAEVPRLTPLEERVLRLLLGKVGTVRCSFIYETLYGLDSDVLPNITAVVVSNLRRKLADTSIHICTDHGRGWYIDRSGASNARALAA